MGAKKEKRPLTAEQETLFTDVLLNTDSLVEDLKEEMEKAKGRLPCREFSIVLTKLEEAQMWAERGFTALGYEPPEPDEDEDEGESDDDGDSDEAESDATDDKSDEDE